AVQTQQIQYMPDMPDVRALASQSSSRAAAQTRSELAIPLTLGSEVIAVLRIESELADAFSTRDRLVAELLGTQAGSAISNVEGYTREVNLLTQVTDVAKGVVAATGDFEALANATIEGAIRVTGLGNGYCALLLADGGMVRIADEWGGK